MKIDYREEKVFNELVLKSLYDDVGWTAYTENMSTLIAGFKNSLAVISAWDHDKLIGLIRVVGDGKTIIYIQDLLVLPAYQNRGLGSDLLVKVLLNYKDVRQKILLTNDEPKVRAFYEKQLFSSCDQGDLVCFAKIT
ncbi:hypothetical protein DH09_11970 [Bacillaceae bacterium JMAK1]|nr:hypothetical protein DH09_11970 [Bacillaceae bacterium JMAK1]